MGSGQSLLSSEAGVVTVIVVSAIVGYGIGYWAGSKSSKRSNLNEEGEKDHEDVLQAPEYLTENQRHNDRKKEAAKAAKHDREKQRLALLAQHKQALEQERMKQQYSEKSGSGKGMSEGMSATVDNNGRLVWK
ncbi:hypothetical protein V5O48_006250 [Marasmius crinis-equi]|uniref:Uncharacterized protein n=1 Tax=Marasmius crinis-equi TaxID=585013 RepID=A0ABR3FK09_9AGAR